MTIRYSTALRNGVLNNTGVKASMADGVLKLFSGPQPTNADSAEQGTLIATITLDAGAWSAGSATNGLEFDAPVSGVLSKAAAETWRGLAVAAGTPQWFRFVANAADAGGSSTTLNRIDGSVGGSNSGADLILSKTSYAINDPITVDTFAITEGNT